MGGRSIDNSDGSYSSLPTTHIKRGAQVELYYGYRINLDEFTAPGKFFLEDWMYSRANNKTTLTLYCTDAWGLLEKYSIPGPQEFNLSSDSYVAYSLIGEYIIYSIGGQLGYKFRSPDIIGLYLRLEVCPGESGSGLLKRILELVPDVILFSGMDGYIVYPQSSDIHTYTFYHPFRSTYNYHYIHSVSYKVTTPYQMLSAKTIITIRW